MSDSGPRQNSFASAEAWARWRGPMEAVVALLAVAPLVLFLVAALERLRYPFPLEQLEGPMLLAAIRVAHHLPIYVRPNFSFIPYMYAPAYYYLAGWMVHWLGPRFFALRLISLLSTCGCFAIIYCMVLLDTAGTRKRRHLAALAGVALYAAAYPWTREWFDLGRLDSLYIFLLLLALYCTRRLHPLLAALAWTLTFLTKQTIFPVALLMLCCDWKRPRRVLMGAGSFLLMTAVSTRLLDHATHGWFWFYAFTVPHTNADLLLRPAVFFVPLQLLAPFGIALLIVGIAWVRTRRTSVEADPSDPSGLSDLSAMRLYLLAAVSLIGLCWFLQAHAGATSNTPMPAYAILAVIFGIAFGRLDASLAMEGCREPARILLLVAVGVQFLSGVYYPHDIIPQRPVLASHEALIAWLRIFPGDVFLPAHPYQAVLAGKAWHPDVAALHDALRPDDPQIRRPLLAEIRAAIDQEKFDAIVLDGTPEPTLADQTWLPADVQKHYPITGVVPGSDVWDRFAPHPVYFLLPCREQSLAVTQGWVLLRPANRIPACTAQD